MEIREQLYEGKAKKVFATENPEVVLVDYKDDATAGNGAKKGTIRGKGVVNNRVTNHLMKMLMEKGIPTHLVEEIDDRRTLVKSGGDCPPGGHRPQRGGGEPGQAPGPCGGDQAALHRAGILLQGRRPGGPHGQRVPHRRHWRRHPGGGHRIADYSFRVNQYLGEYLAEVGIQLIDFKLEFGRLPDGTIVLADEISPDTCRFWDVKTGAHLDKDLFRRDLGGEEAAYQEVMKRLLGE